MLFNSIDFIFFFPAVVGLYFALPYRWRWSFVLLASYFFYGCWKAEYLLLILLSTAVDYTAGLQMSRYEDKRGRRPWLLLSLFVNLGLLGVFKYSNMFSQTANTVFGWMELPVDVPYLNVLLPVGISFYTFQTLAYSIDVYRGRQVAERHLGIFALYVSFFPQLVAGPIERSQHLLPQFHERHPWDWTRVLHGLHFMLFGFFLKLVIADRAGIYTKTVWDNLPSYGAAELWFSTVTGSYQFYGDFAGYSLIAIGAAKVMGYDLMQNFNRPFASQSIGEFWRRFHISLMTWLRDYLFVPLNGGGRVTKRRGLFNLFIVFLISGVWHGAGWTFVLWGCFHGAAVVIGNLTRKKRNRMWKRISKWEASVRERLATAAAPVRAAGVPALRVPFTALGIRKVIAILITFHTYAFSGLLFYSATISDSWYSIKTMLTWRAVDGPLSWLEVSGFSMLQLAILISAVVFVEVWQLYDDKEGMFERLMARSRPVRWAVYYAVIFAILFLGMLDAQTFIYFQF